MRAPRPPRLPRYQPKREIPWMMTMGHYMPWAYSASMTAQVAWDAAGEPPGWPSYVASAVGYAAIVTLVANVMQHMNYLCERCAAATPLDPEKAVRRRRLLLRTTHLEWFFWIFLSVIAAQVAGDKFIPAGSWRYAWDALACVAVVFLMASTWAHNRLQPWCPWCRWGRGGKHEMVPSPDPAMAL